jgi:hypothetical protein
VLRPDEVDRALALRAGFAARNAELTVRKLTPERDRTVWREALSCTVAELKHLNTGLTMSLGSDTSELPALSCWRCVFIDVSSMLTSGAEPLRPDTRPSCWWRVDVVGRMAG